MQQYRTTTAAAAAAAAAYDDDDDDVDDATDATGHDVLNLIFLKNSVNEFFPFVSITANTSTLTLNIARQPVVP